MELFKSPQRDLEKITKLDIMQKQLRDLRDDNIQISKDLKTIIKGVALLVSVPQEDEIEDV